MANFYTYFIASLPMLHFGARPPLSLPQFLGSCREFIPEEDLRILENLPQPQGYAGEEPAHPLIARWVAFDQALRNELVKIRSSRRHTEAAKYLRPTQYLEAHLAEVALSAHRSPSLIEGERILDQARWNFLEELQFGHYFDLEFLLVYAYKLLILERWERIRSADAAVLLEKALAD